jgi:hypothetical protein
MSRGPARVRLPPRPILRRRRFRARRDRVPGLHQRPSSTLTCRRVVAIRWIIAVIRRRRRLVLITAEELTADVLVRDVPAVHDEWIPVHGRVPPLVDDPMAERGVWTIARWLRIGCQPGVRGDRKVRDGANTVPAGRRRSKPDAAIVAERLDADRLPRCATSRPRLQQLRRSGFHPLGHTDRGRFDRVVACKKRVINWS